MPFIIPLLPALSALNDHSWYVEGIFIFLIAMTTITIINGYRLHKSYPTLIYAGLGFSFLITSLFLHVAPWGLIASSVGSVFMLMAQYTNYRLCRVQTCCPNPHS